VKKPKTREPTLRDALRYAPVELEFGTSGLRGLVRDMTNLEVYINSRAFLANLVEVGDILPGAAVCVAGDLRPSTAALVSEAGDKGEILQAVLRAIEDSGFTVVFLGRVPTPALMLHAMKRHSASIMVTGSHIPFNRNGIKFNQSRGEILKTDEVAILAKVRKVRAQVYGTPYEKSIFDELGMIREELRAPLPREIPDASIEYANRYITAFPRGILAGKRILVYQHSAVGRDILVEILGALGAEAVPAGRTDTFLPIDTEAVDGELLRTIQALVEENEGGSIDAVVSTDGDGDRPLVLGVEAGRVRFLPGDLLGIVTADFLGARAVAVPVSASDAVDIHFRARGVIPVRTRVGSPYVIAAMTEVGWESNGGFLSAAPLAVPGGGTLDALPTRDAVLPILCALAASLGAGSPVAALFDRLPSRFGSSAILREVPRESGRRIAAFLSPSDSTLEEARFDGAGISIRTSDGAAREASPLEPLDGELRAIRDRLSRYFPPSDGFGEVRWVNWLDGVQAGFASGDIAHLRPSGNAPELRLYAFSDTQRRAERIATHGVAADGALPRLKRDVEDANALSSFRAEPRGFFVEGAVQNYEWGGFEFLPALIGARNTERKPFAELWIGTHPKAPSVAKVEGHAMPLDRLVREAGKEVLGPGCLARFGGRLPYLFKVLDARTPLSIQAHPSREQAAAGFARENAAGMPLDSPLRNYRDENHKPEAQAALSDVWMLHGFRPLEEIAEVMSTVPELGRAYPDFPARVAAAGTNPAARSGLLRDLYGSMMRMPQTDVDARLDALISRLEAEENEGALDQDRPGFWALRAARMFPVAGGHRDRGIFSIYLLNLLHLRPGQGTFQPAGTLHAYLEGTNVELMANSDNVLRGGLTSKRIDVDELLATLTFSDAHPTVLEGRPRSDTGRVFETPAEEFVLERIEVAIGTPHGGGRAHGPDCLIVLEGSAALLCAGRAMEMTRGAICLVPGGVAYTVAARAPKAVLYRAGVPSDQPE
jgi:phosphomannomutase